MDSLTPIETLRFSDTTESGIHPVQVLENSYAIELEGYYHPLFQISLSIAMGLLLSPFSWGLFVFIFVFIIFELYYAYLRGFRYTPDEMSYRALSFFLGLLAFLFGRYYSGDDDPLRQHYDNWDL